MVVPQIQGFSEIPVLGHLFVASSCGFADAFVCNSNAGKKYLMEVLNRGENFLPGTYLVPDTGALLNSWFKLSRHLRTNPRFFFL